MRHLLRDMFWYAHLRLFFPERTEHMQTLLARISERHVQVTGSLGTLVLQGSLSPLAYRAGIDVAHISAPPMKTEETTPSAWKWKMWN